MTVREKFGSRSPGMAIRKWSVRDVLKLMGIVSGPPGGWCKAARRRLLLGTLGAMREGPDAGIMGTSPVLTVLWP